MRCRRQHSPRAAQHDLHQLGDRIQCYENLDHDPARAASDLSNLANVRGVSYGGTQLTWNYYTNSTTNTSGSGTNIVTDITTNIGNVLANPQDINTAGGLQWTSKAPFAVIWVSYGTLLVVSNYPLSAPSISNPNDANYNTPYTTIELTYY